MKERTEREKKRELHDRIQKDIERYGGNREVFACFLKKRQNLEDYSLRQEGHCTEPVLLEQLETAVIEELEQLH